MPRDRWPTHPQGGFWEKHVRILHIQQHTLQIYIHNVHILMTHITNTHTRVHTHAHHPPPQTPPIPFKGGKGLYLYPPLPRITRNRKSHRSKLHVNKGATMEYKSCNNKMLERLITLYLYIIYNNSSVRLTTSMYRASVRFVTVRGNRCRSACLAEISPAAPVSARGATPHQTPNTHEAITPTTEQPAFLEFSLKAMLISYR
jgi:hypothetical protein